MVSRLALRSVCRLAWRPLPFADYLTSDRHGAGFSGYLANHDTGNASFRKYCIARGLFLSPIEQNQRNAGAFVKEIAEICNSAIVWRQGKLNLIPYGDVAITGNGVTYTPDLTPLYDLTTDDFLFEKGQPPVKHSAKNPSQQFNHVRIEYNARSNDYNPLIVEVKDQADIDDNGLRTKAVTQYKCITLNDVARDVAQHQMQRDLFVVNSYSFRLGIRHSLLEPMDFVTITDAGLGLDRQLVRIVEVIEQDDSIDVVAEEVNVGVANAPKYNTVNPLGYNQDFNAAPGNTQNPLIMNAPGALTETGFEMWINATGVNAALWGGCEVWISDDNAEYRYVGVITGPARYGALTTTMAAGSNNYDTTTVARVQLYNGEILGGTQADCDNYRTLLFVGGEWMSYRDATLVIGSTYDLDTFRRAAYGSTRTSHAAGQALAVIDEATFRLPYDKGNRGKTVYMKFPAFNVFGGALQDLADCTAYTHTIGASEMTAPMDWFDLSDLSDDVALALSTAQNAQATADGKITSFWQTSPPAIGSGAGQAKVGDIWFDTDDGNKVYRVVGGSWTVAADDDLAAALLAASTAQATADGKVQTFFTATAPTATAIGDLWFNTTTKELYRWNGSAWTQKISDITVDQLAGNGANLMLNEYSQFATYPTLSGSAGALSADAAAIAGNYLRFTTASTTTTINTYLGTGVTDFNMPLEPGDYILSFYAKSNVAGHLILPSIVHDVGGGTEVWFNGGSSAGGDTALTTTRTRYAGRITIPAGATAGVMRLRWNRSGVSGRTVDIDGIMLEPALGTKVVASVYVPGTLRRGVADAIAAAAAALDVADGKIETYFQTSMPAGASLGDLWFDTDDGNKMYRHNGTTFVVAQDTAIGTAISNAAGAQATADGKVTTYYAGTAPGGTKAVGDLWYDTTNKVLNRWNGSTWIQVSDITADKIAGRGTNLMWDEYSRFNNAATFPTLPKSGSVTTLDYASGVDVGSSGGGSLRAIINDPTGTTSNSWVYFGASSVDYRLPLEPGKKYILSAYFKTNQAAGINVLMRVKDSTGAFIGSTGVAVPGGSVLTRRSVVVDCTAMTTYNAIALFYLNYGGATNSYTVWIDRIQVEELVGNDTTPSAWSPGPSGLAAERAIANAATAQSTADGKIDSFYQASPPGSASEGDLWFDTDDGNKCYTRRSGAWVLTQDSQIGAAISAAAGAQATADGKVTTFYQTTTPTAVAVGDLWYNKQTMLLSRWNGSAWIANGTEPTGGNGENLLVNPNFIVNTAGAVDGGVAAVNDPVGDGWYAKNVFASRADTDVRWYNNGRIRVRIYGTVAIAAGASVNPTAATLRKIPVEAGRKYRGSFTIDGGSYNGTAAASVSYLCRMTVRWYDSAGAQISYSLVVSAPARSPGAQTVFADVTAPSTAVSCEIGLEGYISNGSGASWTHDNTVALNQYFTKASFQKIADLDTEIQDGSNYGRLANNDLYSSGGLNRLGLRFGASGHRLGSQRNYLRSGTSAYGMVRTTTALSATSAGAVSVNAHTVRYGGYSVAYNAVSNAVTGLTVGSTYCIYCTDADLSGGTKTYFAAANPEAAMNISDDIYVVGQITIPSSGSSSGGSGGSGTNPGDWCVAADSFMPDGRFAEEMERGMMLPCYNNRPETPNIFHLPIQANLPADDQECVRLVTVTGASIVASKTTPMTLRSGKCVMITDMLHREVIVYRLDGSFTWEEVEAVEYAGRRRVAKISVSDQCYFAGETMDAFIATHNIQQMKP